MASLDKMRALVAVGSRHDRVCSVGAFARAEARALERVFGLVRLVEPNADDAYPAVAGLGPQDVVFFHAPSLHDRGRPWRPLQSVLTLRRTFPSALFVPIVHEYSEAPLHWRARQIAIARLAHGLVVNSEADFEGLRHWHSRVLRSRLGPTLFNRELIAGADSHEAPARLSVARRDARDRLVGSFGATHSLVQGERWLLHPGLLVPGKGVNSLTRLARALPVATRLIIMGGIGPKPADREFADRTLAELRTALAGGVSFVDSPTDEVFKDFLLASDLVVLPYDNGLSERRSSFLSAMCCGANVWTTVGHFSGPMGLEASGAHSAAVESWLAGERRALESVANALCEDDAAGTRRRLQNLRWSVERSWESRANAVGRFILALRG